MKNLLFKRRCGAGSALVLILTWFALVVWIYLYYPAQQPKSADNVSKLNKNFNLKDVAK